MDSRALEGVGKLAKIGLVAVVLAAIAFPVGLGLMMYTIISSPSAAGCTCSGEVCPCDAVDAEAVAEWLNDNRPDVVLLNRNSRAMFLKRARTKAAFEGELLLEVTDWDETGEAGEDGK